MATDDRAVLVLLHGFTHTGVSWDDLAAATGDRYRVLAPDIRGHGRASDALPVGLMGAIDDIAGIEAAEFTLAVYSMGGRIALHVALSCPERVRRLILIGASAGIADPAQRAARRRDDEHLADEIERLTIEQAAELWERRTTVGSRALLAGQRAGVRQAIREDRLRNTPAGLAAALRGLGTGALPSLWDRLGELRMPVTLIVGEHDQKFRAIAAQMALRIERARVAIVPGVSHAAHLEAPEAVAALL